MKTTILAILFVMISACDDTSWADLIDILPENITENDVDSSIFISDLDIDVDPEHIKSISFSIQPKVDAVASPLMVTYEIDDLPITDEGIKLPIYGMYDNHINNIDIQFIFTDNSRETITIQIETELYVDPNGIYNDIQINTRATMDNKPSYDYMHLKSYTGPLIMDIDGYIRWIGNEVTDTRSSLYEDGKFIYHINGQLITTNLNGDISTATIHQEGLSNITHHHDLVIGKYGYLVHVTADKIGRDSKIRESILLEVDSGGNTIKEWDFGEIIANHMVLNGDDPGNFVRDGSDWFHMNSAIYSPDDDTIIVSSRENFVIKIDYSTGTIKWLFGDDTKYWFTYPSLAALSLQSNDIKPIGQHALSIVDDKLMLFNNGTYSLNQPNGESEGELPANSRPSQYSINEQEMTAELLWSYDAGVFSPVCSSVYKYNDNYLIVYSSIGLDIDNWASGAPQTVLIQGITHNKDLLFEMQFNVDWGCSVAWNMKAVYF